MKSNKKDIFSLLGAFAAGFLLQIVAAFAVMLPAMLLGQNVNEYLGLTVLVTHVVLLVSFGLWYVLGCRGQKNLKTSLKQIFVVKHIVIIVILAIGSCCLTNFVMPIAGLIIPEEVMQAYMELMETAGFGESILPTIAAVLIAPFGEEFIFRGVMYHYACNIVSVMKSKRSAFYVANTIQALAFGVFHGNLVQGTYAFFLGLVLGYLKERFNSIFAPVLAHVLINGCSAFLWEPIALLLPESILVFGAGALVFGVVVVLGFRMGGSAVSEKEN